MVDLSYIFCADAAAGGFCFKNVEIGNSTEKTTEDSKGCIIYGRMDCFNNRHSPVFAVCIGMVV